MIELVSAVSLWELVKHAGSWLINLRKAKQVRQRESIDALRKVVIAARRTAVYTRQLSDTGRPSHAVEAELATLWTELGFALDDLGLDKLAKRCKISGRHWADPDDMDKAFLEKADIGLARMEQLASEMLHEIER